MCIRDRPYSPRLYRALGRAARQLLEIKKEGETERILESTGTLPLTLLQTQGEMDRLLEEPPSQEVVDRILDFYFQVRDFLNISELVDENYEIYTSEGEDGKFKIRLFCVNPASNLQECLNKGKSTVFFSATLLPKMCIRDSMGTDQGLLDKRKARRQMKTGLVLEGGAMRGIYTAGVLDVFLENQIRCV